MKFRPLIVEFNPDFSYSVTKIHLLFCLKSLVLTSKEAFLCATREQTVRTYELNARSNSLEFWQRLFHLQ